MQLSKREIEMLEGKYGYPAKKSMEILIAVGECYDAPRMISVSSAHLVGCNPITGGRAGAAFIRELADKGGKFIISTSTNPACLDPWNWKELKFEEGLYQEQIAVNKAVVEMGGFLSLTCTPYLTGHVPRAGEHIAWSESSATIFANSVLGARTSRESGPTVLAAALTGVTPEYGYHLPENCYGQVKIAVKTELKGTTQYGTLGYFTGKVAKEKVPIFVGISPYVSSDELKSLGAGMAVSGSVALYHVVGVTLNAYTEEQALGSKKLHSSDIYEFGIKELNQTQEFLSKKAPRGNSLVILGCPHASISELKYYAQVLSGKKVVSDIWILTSRIVRQYAEKMGYIESIESNGARVLNDTCSLTMPRGHLKKLGYEFVITDSAKMANYVPGIHDLPCYYSNLEQYIIDSNTKTWV